MTEGMARVVAGRYRLVRPVGRGGMGVVWHAHDTLLGRDVAVKEVWLPAAPGETVDPADPLLRRALREAQAAARLRHPGIVTVYDVVTDDGRPWIVMELIDGRSLAEAVREHGLLTEQRTAEIGLQVLGALQAAHREGVAHRDVKPANILLDAADRVVLTDFGIAAIDDATALTATGQMVGSPAYLAPERINGLPATAAGDLWALGVTLYTAVTGRSPFQREDTQATFAAILTARPAVPAHAGQLWPVIKGLLTKDPVRRLTAEQARPLLAKAAQPAGGAGTGRRQLGWWPGRGKRRPSDRDELRGTLAAPAPTLAAPTAYQAPGEVLVPGASAPVTAGTTMPESITGDATPPETVPAATVPAATVPAATVPVETAEAETAAATVAAATVGAGTAGVAAMAPVPIAAGPLAPYPEQARRARTARTRTVWLAALAALTAGAVLVTSGILPSIWPGPGGDGSDGGDHAAGLPSANTLPSAGVASAEPSAAASRAVSPELDRCLVGRWRVTSTGAVHTIDGAEHGFVGTGGSVLRVWPNGKAVEDHAKSAPLQAAIKGIMWTDTRRGTETSRMATRNGQIYASDISGTVTSKLTRNGRVVPSKLSVTSPYEVSYVCTETALTTYGYEKRPQQTYRRLSHTP